MSGAQNLISANPRTAFSGQFTKTGLFQRAAKDQKIAQLEARVAQQEAKIVQKNEVIAELMEENVRAKKSIGEL